MTCRLTTWRFLILSCLSFSLLCLSADQAPASLNIECGIGGYVKAQQWFPIQVADPSPDIVRLDVYLMAKDWREETPKKLVHFADLPKAGQQTRGQVLCKFPSISSGESFIRCDVTYRDGTHAIKDAPYRPLSDGDLLVLVASDRHDDFDFLGSIERKDRGITRVVSCGPKGFPSSWQALDSIDVVVLDGAVLEYTPAQHEALAAWMLAGGTIILTDRGLLAEAAHNGWGLFPEVEDVAPYTNCPSERLAPLLGKTSSFFEGLRILPAHTDPAFQIFLSGNDVILSAKDSGYGRIIASGIDWRTVTMKDRVNFEMVRKAIWGRLLDLRRPIALTTPTRESVFPKEVRAKYLVKPLGLFLLAYIILLGPVNWLILRAIRKQEYSVVSLPAGALLFSLFAFLIGIMLRTRQPILYEAELLFAPHGQKGFVTGIAGLLSPDHRPYQLSLPDSFARLDLGKRRYGGDDLPKTRDILTFSFGQDPAISNIRMETWSMRFFSLETVVDLGGGISATASCTRTAMEGLVESRLPFVLKDAYVMYRWNRIGLGDIQPGASRQFSLTLAPRHRTEFTRCPNCHRYHGGEDWLSEEYSKKHPLAPGIREFITDLDGWHALAQPVLIGWQDAPTNFLHSDQIMGQLQYRRFCVIPVDLRFDGRDVHIPQGLVPASAVSMNQQSLTFPHVAQMAGRLATLDPAELDALNAVGRTRDPFEYSRERPSEPRMYDFYLPFVAPELESHLLQVYWDAGEVDPESTPEDYILSIFNWEDNTWQELGRASSGEHTLEADDPSPLIRLPFPVVRLQIVAAKQGSKASYYGNSPEIAYEGWKIDGAKGHDKH